MRVVARCPACQRREVEDEEGGGDEGTTIPLRPGTIVPWTCANGHSAFYWNSAPFFEALFAEGVQKFAEGDTRGAVLSFYATWDNFTAYAIRLIVDDTRIGAPIPKDYSLAERRVGLYAGLVFARTKEWPEIASQDAVAIRNKVIHDDKIPSDDEVMKVAESVRKAIAAAKRILGGTLFEAEVKGAKAERRLEDALKAAGVADRTQVTVVFEGGSLVDTDVRELVRALHAGAAGA